MVLVKTLPVLIALRGNRIARKTHPSALKRGASHCINYDRRLVQVMHENGILDPWETLHAARHVRGYLSVCCALLQMESEGGKNIFGSDPGALNPAWYGTEVTWLKYLAYKGKVEIGGVPTGVGPCQLGEKTLQHGADLRGGCWVPICNMTEGFLFITRLIGESGSIWSAFRDLKGRGESATEYADQASTIQQEWSDRFKTVR